MQVNSSTDVFFDTKRTVLIIPDITIRSNPDSTLQQNNSVEVEATWTNPLSTGLNNVVISYYVVPGLSINGETEEEINVGTIPSGQSVSVSMGILGIEVGTHLISVTLESNELSDVRGQSFIEVTKVDSCDGDFDTDGDVDGSDLAVFAADFGRTNCGSAPPCEGDFDNDNDVDGSDLATFAADFGRTDCP